VADNDSASKAAYPIYSVGELSAEFRQGEIITGVGKYIVNPITEAVIVERHEYSVIATQDCDLLQDHRRRASEEVSSLSGVLIFPMVTAISAWDVLRGTDIKKRIRQNKDERYHLLQRITPEYDLAGNGRPALLIDFKKFFTMSPEELFYQFQEKTAVRRCRLEMPYREHLQTRAAFYFQRIMLPEAHRFDFESEKAIGKN
jgi:hypothetical protein